MTRVEEFLDYVLVEDENKFHSFNTWSLAMVKLAMKFADAYANKRELEVRLELDMLDMDQMARLQKE